MNRTPMYSRLAGAGLVLFALASGPLHAQSTTKKELIQKILLQQQPVIESLARGLVEQPASMLMQSAGRVMQSPQVPPEKREEVGKAIEADVKKYLDESVPLLRDRAIKLAPSTLGAAFEEKFSEDELKQLLAWLESPTNKKFVQMGPEMQNNFGQKLVNDSRATIEPKLKALEVVIAKRLGIAPAPAASAGSAPKK